MQPRFDSSSRSKRRFGLKWRRLSKAVGTTAFRSNAGKPLWRPHETTQRERAFFHEDIEAGLITAGYVFEPPGHFRTTSLAEILAGLADDELAAWPGQLADQERERRGAFSR
ncbi:hypothetical protein IPC462_02335 [Pseudomonas aeruginosa]|nr:hypothetical protein IPC462_02335 [Pseudomonas aeruginosa]TQR67302.1 hypothetical protein DMY46_11370 [Pseudomonas aeruginosa]